MSRASRRCGILAMAALIAWVPSGVATSAEAQQISLGPYHGDGTPVIMAALAAVPDTAVLYAAGDDGLYRSEDGGAHWTLVFSDPIGLFTVAVDPLDPSTVYAGSTGGLFRSTDSGVAWTKVLDDATSALAFDPSGALYVGTASLHFGDFAFVLRTADRGASWTRLQQLGLYDRVSVLAVDAVSPENLYAGTADRTFLRSTDGGASWSAVYEGWYGRISAIAVHPRANATLYAASVQEFGFPEDPFHCNVVKSTDFGHTWETLLDPTQDCGFSSVAVEPFGRHRIFASADTLYVSNDAGRTFSPIPDAPFGVSAFAFDPRRPGHLYVAGVGVSEIILETPGRGIEFPASSPPPTRTLPPRPSR
jgi:photosystem II stability/assembly factor-like uncharacterized protein